jgi:hypothetical protein
MEKVYMRKGQIIAFSLAVWGMVLFDVIAIIISFIKDDASYLGLGIIMGGSYETLFIPILIITYKQKLVIGKTRIVFFYKTFSPYKEYRRFNCKGMEIRFSEIQNIAFEANYGDGFMTSDTTFVTFYLKNGKNFKTVFYNYGKKQEKEILSALKAVNERILK